MDTEEDDDTLTGHPPVEHNYQYVRGGKQKANKAYNFSFLNKESEEDLLNSDLNNDSKEDKEAKVTRIIDRDLDKYKRQ